MFSRNILQFNPHLANKYYSANPEKEDVDRKIHKKPELGEPDHLFYDPYRSPIFKAAFDYLIRTRDIAWGAVATKKIAVDRGKITKAIIGAARLYGACDVSVTQLRPYHFYTHRGRHEKGWGEEIHNSHRSAIVIVVPMDVKMMKFAPGLPTIQESAHQYVEAAKIADILAQYLRSFGYDARSHKDSNYETLCVPLAIDSGLGVLGRLGIFMHHELGPCVRLSIVTTEMELAPTQNHPVDKSPEHFCKICKKCADNCPVQAINGEEETSSRGFRHWTIDQEKCYSFWKSVGTDCGMCIRVCPYTKPNTFIHKLIRFYVSRNSFNQRLALFFDDLVYGRNFKFQ
jgi:reductive dehalogenase